MLPARMRTRAAASTTRSPAAPRIPRLGERLRQLRVAAGLTQTDLAGDRFSKEYISQIERGKTRPTIETVEWLALRLGIDAGFLASGVSADERAKAEAILARADVLSQEHRFDGGDRGVHAGAAGRARDGSCRASGPCVERRGDGACADGRREVGARAAGRVARTGRGRDVHGRRPRRRSLPPRRLPVQAFEHLDRGCAVRRGAVARRALGPSVRRAEAERLCVALTVLSAPARLRSLARGRRARARARGGAA